MDPVKRLFLQRGVTPRQFEVLQLHFGELMRESEIAARLFISENTVNRHIYNAADKLGYKRRELRRIYLETRSEAIRNLDDSLAGPVQWFAARHPDDIEDVVGEVLVLYQSPGLKGLTAEHVPDFVVHSEDWPLSAELRTLAVTPVPDVEFGDDGAKWALWKYEAPISHIREHLVLHVRPFRYFWARRTIDRLDVAKTGGMTLRERYWDEAVPLHTSPLGNLLVVHAVVTLTDRDGKEYVLFTRRRDNPEIVSYEQGAWSATFEEHCRGDPSLSPGTALKPPDRSVWETAIRGLREELGIETIRDAWILSLILEWSNGYTGVVLRLHLDLRSHPTLAEPVDVENAWRFKHMDREADAVRLLPFTRDVLVPLVFEGQDRDHWLPPPPGRKYSSLHRTTPVRVFHVLNQAGMVTAEVLRRIDRTLLPFRPDALLDTSPTRGELRVPGDEAPKSRS